MADLAQLQSGVSVTPYQTKALNLGQEPPPALPADTSKLSRAQGHAALMGTVAQTLSQLPSLILGNYMKGKTIPTQLKANEALAGVLGGTKPNLPEGTSITPDGVTYKAPDPDAANLNRLKQEETQADIDYKKARAKALADKPPGGTETNPLVAAFGDPNDSAAPSGGVVPADEKRVGRVTSYGYGNDTFGGPNAAASRIGANNNRLDGQSLAVSPDVEADLARRGYKLGDTVTLETAGGGTITRRWDDRTAQWDSTGKWSVDDKGNFIDKSTGKAAPNLPEAQRLPALKGRFDFHAEPVADASGRVVKWVPSRYVDTQITGLTRKARAGGALANDDLPLPQKPTVAVRPALAGIPALASDGMPVTMDMGNPNGPGAAAPSKEALAALLAPDNAPATPAAPVAYAGAVAPLDFRAEPSTVTGTPGALETDAASGLEFAPDGMPKELPGFFPEASEVGAGTPDLPLAPTPTAAPASAPTPPIAPDGTLNPEGVFGATGGRKISDSGHAGGTVTRFPGFDREELPDGTVYVYRHQIKPGQKPFEIFKKPMHYSVGTVKLASEAGYQPKPGETEASVSANARAALNEAERVPPDARPVFMKWGSSLQSNPVIKEYYTARHQRDVVEAALSTGLSPAAALGVIDAYVKAMRGGAATQGMTKILEEGQPLIERAKLLKQKIMGTSKDNAVLTKDMAEDVRHILGEIDKASRKEVEAMREGDKEYLSTIGIPAGAVEKTYKRILTGTKTSLDSMSPDAVAPGAPDAPGTPAEIQTKKAAAAKAVKAKYDAGGYTGEEKTRAEALLRANGLL